jgi:hypothetical protein
MTKKRFILAMLVAVALVGVLAIPGVRSRVKSYYYGDAISFNGRLIIGTTNMNGFELFTLDENKIIRQSKLSSFRATYSGFSDYRDVAFSIEDKRLFAYLTDGDYLYKMDLADLRQPQIIFQGRDTAWDWFKGVAVVDGRLVTIGTKGIKVWNQDMQVIDNYPIIVGDQRNVSFSPYLTKIFVIEGGKIQVYDTNSRQFVASMPVETAEDHGRKMYNRMEDSSLYVVDDKAVKKFSLSGILGATFRHIANRGYDVVPSTDGQFVYFSDGIGIVRLQAEDLKLDTYAFTIDLGEKNGWAMGLKVVKDATGEKVIVFNNSNLLVLNADLKKIGHIKASDDREDPIAPLSLSVDRNRAAGNSDIMLSGKGFGLNEDLEITFASTRMLAKTDDSGSFRIIVKVPAVLPTMTDIKVTGKSSKLTYSTNFQIE